MQKFKYIAVDGPIGVGKTTLSGLLGKAFDAKVVLEPVKNNPFLPLFYSDRKKYAFQTQMAFLIGRYQQQKDLEQQGLFEKGIITDYLFARDRIFAHINLNEEELALYEKIYELLNPRVIKPDIVIYLQADVDVLLDRIYKRGYNYERGIDREYLERVVKVYNDFFFYYNETAVLVVNTSSVDFEKNEEDLTGLIKEIRRLKSGTHYYIPLGSGKRP
jgi:deoxyadenosine/deoxycytidine kinase